MFQLQENSQENSRYNMEAVINIMLIYKIVPSISAYFKSSLHSCISSQTLLHDNQVMLFSRSEHVKLMSLHDGRNLSNFMNF